MRGRAIGGAAALAAAVALLGGCGSSASSTALRGASTATTASATTSVPSSSSSSSSSQSGNQTEQFKAAITPVFDQFKAASHATGVEIQNAGKQTNTQVAAAFDRLVGPWQSGLDKLKSLSPPPAYTAAVNHLEGQVSSVVSDVKAVAAAARKNDAGSSSTAARNLIRDILGAKATSAGIDRRLGIH